MRPADWNLDALSTDQLVSLRDLVNERLERERSAMERRLAAIENCLGEPEITRRRGVKRGTKFAPKYRGPAGETWSGRGRVAVWLQELIRNGHRREDFEISG